MSKQQYRIFLYLKKDDYDKKRQINRDELPVYSKKKLKELYPGKDRVILGETYEKKKRDREKDVGKIELNDKLLYVGESGRHCRLFKKQDAFVEVEGGGLIALLKNRLLPILLIGALLLGLLAGGLSAILGSHGGTQSGNDAHIKPIKSAVLTVTGVVTKDGKPQENAALSLQYGSEEIAAAATDAEGKYLINDVKNGNYNLVCTCGESIMTKIASVFGESIVVNFTFPADDLHDVETITGHHEKEDLPVIEPTDENSGVKAIVRITDDKTPPIAVGGLAEEAMLHMIAGKEIDLTLFATLLEGDSIPANDKAAIEAISGDLEMTYYDFSILKEVFKDKILELSEYLERTKIALEIAVPFDSSHSIATYAFRCHDGAAMRMQALESKPVDNYTDGTYYIAKDTVYIYTSYFSTYAVGTVYDTNATVGGDSITYNNVITVHLNDNTISMLYMHDSNSTSDAVVQIYLVGEQSNVLISESGIVPIGSYLDSMFLKSDRKNMPSVGTYEGLMKIIYFDEKGGQINTSVEIPVGVVITQ